MSSDLTPIPPRPMMDWAPLEALAIAALKHDDEPITDRAIARYLNVGSPTVVRGRANGGISPLRADVIAVHLGFHPALIWGDAWWHASYQDHEIDELLALNKVLSRRRRQKERRTNAGNH